MPTSHYPSWIGSFTRAGIIAVQVCLLLALLCSSVMAQGARSDHDCPDNAANLGFWASIYQQRADTTGNTDELAVRLLPCLGSESPTLRDTYGYGLYTYWLRNEELSLDTKQTLFGELLNNLDSDNSLLRSFSALILSEILRADAIDSFLSATDRQILLQKSSAALLAETDYRGLDQELGWIHPVAHLADVQWRFALHPKLSAEQATTILQTIAAKAVTDENSYVFNESDRLARVVAIIIRTEILPASDISDWLEQFSLRANGETWASAFSSTDGMTELHNAKGFIRSLDSQLADLAIPDLIRERLTNLNKLLAQLV